MLSHKFRPLIFISCFPFKTSWLTLFLACNKWRYLEVFLVAWRLVIDTLQDRALWWTNNFLYLFNWSRSSDNYGLRLTYFARLKFRCYLMMIFYNRQKCNKVTDVTVPIQHGIEIQVLNYKVTQSNSLPMAEYQQNYLFSTPWILLSSNGIIAYLLLFKELDVCRQSTFHTIWIHMQKCLLTLTSEH